MIEIIEGTWAAGEVKTFHINGEYLELLDAQYQCDVFLMDKSGAQLSVMKKCEASFFSKPSGGFNTVQISSSQPQYIRFFVGSGDAGTRRISSTVSVVDGEKARTLAGGMYAAAPGCAATAGKFPAVQLWNVGGSPVRVIVNALSVTCDQGGAVNVYFENTNQPTTVNATRAANKLGKAGLGWAQARVSDVGLAGVSGYSIWAAFVQANGYVPWNIKGGIVLPAFSGLTVVGSIAGSSLGANFEWFEELV